MVLGFTGSVGDHDSESVVLAEKCTFNWLGDAADLVHIEEEGVAGLFVDCLLDSGGVGDEEVIADDLDLFSDFGSEFSVGFPVILIEGVFDGNNWVFGDQLLIVGW